MDFADVFEPDIEPEPEPPVVFIRMECCGQFDERDPFMHVCVVRG